ncbi:hypothetical protein COCNU_scaffold021020G000010 [Cocos nucifera]|nr:hypothetical protein [Cocos nucifera]
MESPCNASKNQKLASSFLEIAVGQSAETATKFLQATNWRLEEALQLFFARCEGGESSSPSFSPPRVDIKPTNIFSHNFLYELLLIPMHLKAILISVAVREGSKKRIISSDNKSDTEKDEESSSSSSDCETCTEKDDSSNGKFTYPILGEEPEPEGDRKQPCRVGIRLPDGRRLQRNFHHSDPVKVRNSL